MNGARAIAGRFELVNPHAGSMGEVHHVRDLPTGAADAVRLTWHHRTGEEGLADRGGQERRQSLCARHGSCRGSPNLPWTITGGIDGDRPYLAMEFLDGTTLAWLIDEKVPLLNHTAHAARACARPWAVVPHMSCEACCRAQELRRSSAMGSSALSRGPACGQDAYTTRPATTIRQACRTPGGGGHVYRGTRSLRGRGPLAWVSECVLLESVLGATPQEFESPILRHTDLRRRAWIMFVRCATADGVCLIFCFSLIVAAPAR